MDKIRKDLTEFLGEPITVPQRVLIDRAAWLQMHLAVMDRNTIEGKRMTEHDSKQYLAWNNSLTRTLNLITLNAAKQFLTAAKASPTSAQSLLQAHLAAKRNAAA